MRVLLFVPPAESYVMRDLEYGCWCQGQRVGSPRFPPLNMMYISSVLKENDFDVTLFDGQVVDCDDAVLRRLAGENDFLVISSSNTTLNRDIVFFRKFRGFNPVLKTISFGPQPTFFPENVLKNKEIDFAVMGEPEITIKELLLALRDASSLDRIDGIGFKQSIGQIHINKKRKPLENLDLLPFPDRKSVDPKLYFNPLSKYKKFTTVLGSRGCIGNCSFCTSPPFYDHKYRHRTPKNLIEELLSISRDGYEEVVFRDEIFGINDSHVSQICKEIIRSRIRLKWMCNLRIGAVSERTLRLMKQAGCYYVWLGIESGSQRILNKLSKGITVEQIRETLRCLNKLKIGSHAHFMIGSPSETKEDIDMTIALIKETKPSTIDVAVLTPFPGSRLFDELSKRDPSIGDGTYLDISDSHEKNPYLRLLNSMTEEELKSYMKKIYSGFFLRPGYILKKIITVRSLSEFMYLSKAGLSIVLFAAKK